MDGQVRVAGLSRSPILLLLVAFLTSFFTGCSDERPAAPLAPALAGPWRMLTIWADGAVVAEITDPAVILMVQKEIKVPGPRNPLAGGGDAETFTFTTSDREIIRAVQEILYGYGKQGVGGFSNPEEISWGKIKMLYS